MDIGTILLIAAPSFALGAVTVGVLRSVKIRSLRSTLAAREATIETHLDRITNLGAEIDGTARKLGRVTAENERLKPLAEKGERAVASQLKASKAGHAAKAAKRAKA